MDIIKITIEYEGEMTINGQYSCRGPIEMSWFAGNDLVVEANGKKVTINADKTRPGGVYRLPRDIF